MLQIRRSEERGVARTSWLDSRHTFSFGEYYDPAHMGFRSLRVINDDRVAPGGGFATHGHRDMEIVTYVLDGRLAHKDSLGNGSVIRPGEVQRMSAGTGIQHSEFNDSKTDPVHLLQIWIVPAAQGSPPGYEQHPIDFVDGALQPIAAPPGAGGVVTVHQDAWIHAARLSAGRSVSHDLAAGRFSWVHIARGEVVIEAENLRAGDAVAFAGGSPIVVQATQDAEILLFDLA